MGRAISGDGGCVRPCEYFDLIGGSGLSGLCALLFVRFVGFVSLHALINLTKSLTVLHR
jgi:hypothetical protein